MFAIPDYVTILFGSLSGIAAIVIAINTVLLRRETNRQKQSELQNTERMGTFETSQSSLQAALIRADLENERNRVRMTAQDDEISQLKAEVASLKIQVEELRRVK